MTEPNRMTPLGDLTIFEITGFTSQLQAALAKGETTVIDLCHIGTVDASALQILIAACESGAAELVNAPKRVAEQLTCLGWVPSKGCKVSYVD
jgi:ABC-type transporter Mla MlaB component